HEAGGEAIERGAAVEDGVGKRHPAVAVDRTWIVMDRHVDSGGPELVRDRRTKLIHTAYEDAGHVALLVAVTIRLSAQSPRRSWSISEPVSNCDHCSTIRPSAMRRITRPLHVTPRPVGAIPRKSPRCVPLIVSRAATRSPSATIPSTDTAKSGKAARSIATWRLMPSGPGGRSGE